MDGAEFKSRRELTDKYNIRFLGPVQPESWPSSHHQLFKDVQKLGRQGYLHFSHSITADSIEKPWRRQTKMRAKRLAAQARNCRRDRKNEFGWRYTLETEVFHRFSIEAACPRCRCRLWRSEIEAAVHNNEPFGQSLEERRKNRASCQCPGSSSLYESGVNEIFSDQAQASIKHNPRLEIRKGKRTAQEHEEPDRVYGLRETNNFKALLESFDRRSFEDNNPRPLRESLETSPFTDKTIPLLYPFLIIEAKSDKKGDTAAAELQTAFCIRRLLMLQQNLQDAARRESDWTSNALVWFILSFGERWSVSASFINNSSGTMQYLTVDLWSGDIRNEDSAIQLLLIMDYICDWARDIYRQSILVHLNSLAMADITATDPDIYSTCGRGVSAWVEDQNHDSIPDSNHQQFTNSQCNGPFISPSMFYGEQNDIEGLKLIHSLGAVRDASITESRFLSLHIKESDVASFVPSFASTEKFCTIFSSLAKSLEDSWRATAETLHTIEATWTGKTRDDFSDTDEEGIYYVKLIVLMYLSAEWQPVRQLTCLAVSEQALESLWKEAASIQHAAIPKYRLPNAAATIKSTNITRFLNRALNLSILNNLTAATSMLCLSSTVTKRAGCIPRDLQVQSSAGFILRFCFDKAPVLVNIIAAIYDEHKIGRRLPSDPYLRFSQSVTRQRSDASCTPIGSLCQGLLPHRNGCILIDNIEPDSEVPKRCLYILEGLCEIEDVPYRIRNMCKEGLYYAACPVRRGTSPVQYFRYLNRSIAENGYWQPENFPDIDSWVQGLLTYATGSSGSSLSPIPISSDEESNDREDSDGDTLMSSPSGNSVG